MNRLGARVLLGIPTLSSARRSVQWIDALANLQMPLGSSLGRVWVEDRPIAEARNWLCQKALDDGVEVLVMLGDDVIPPGNLLLGLLDRLGTWQRVDEKTEHVAKLVTGVYWTKTYPPEPYLWNGLLRGSYKAWRVGEFFPVDLAGCDALAIHTDVLKRVAPPWFSTDWTWEEGQQVSPIATEDFYFFSKCRQAGFRLFADTALQCLHEDRATGQCFGLLEHMPQAGGVPELGEADLLVADLGSGTDSPYWGPKAKVVRFDSRPSVRPDYRCDLRALPPEHAERYDLVHARHVLERYARAEAPGVVAGWARLVKPGGRLVVRVPSIAQAARTILEAADHPGTVPGERQLYAWQQLYGAQAHEADRRLNGFLPGTLRKLLERTPGLAEVEVVEEEGGATLCATATRVELPRPESLLAMWQEIERQEAEPSPNGTAEASEAEVIYG